MKLWHALLGAALLFVACVADASAHAQIDHCAPAGGATVATAPSQVVCVMTEEIDTKQSTMSVFDANNVQVDKKDAHVDLNDPDHKTLLVSLDTSAIKNGIYTVKWHTVTPDDNGVTAGSFQFVVGSAASTPGPTTQVVAESTSTATEQATTAASATTSSASETSVAQPTATSAPPTTVPSTGGSGVEIVLLAAFVGALLLIGGMGLKAAR